MRPSSLIVILALGACQAPATPRPATWSCSPRLALSSVWSFLQTKYDRNQDGRVTAAEYDRGEVRFSNFDRNGDGVLTASDFPPDTYFNGFSHMLVRMADGDADEEITATEWAAFGSRLDADADGAVAQGEAKTVLGEWADDWPLLLLSFDQDGDGDFDRIDLELTFTDQDFNGDQILAGRETQGWAPAAERPSAEPPAVGEPAPDFTLPEAADPTRLFRLADAVGRRPIALVFGSYT